jgi:hypothetical protein
MGEEHVMARTKVKALLVTGVLVAGTALAAAGAQAESGNAAGFAGLSSFDAQGVAGVADFQYQYAKIGIIPFAVKGGILESFSDASSSGNAQGLAGPMPIPLLANGSLANPTNDPVTGHPVPESFREAYSKIDFQRLPNSCKSSYPDIYADGSGEANCGGPASNDPALGFTFGAFNGHTKSAGDEKDAMKTKSMANSRAVDVGIPALQAKIHGAWSESKSGLNKDGLAESSGVVDVDGVEILNGFIKLTGLHSEAVAVTDGTEQGSRTVTSFKLGEAYVAGFPVVIGPDGVTVDKQKLPAGQSAPEANKQINEALKRADIDLRLAPPPTPTKNGSQVSIASSGVEIINRGEQVTPANSYYRFPYIFVAANAVANTGDSAGIGGVSSGAGTGSQTTDGSAAPAGTRAAAPTASSGDSGDPGTADLTSSTGTPAASAASGPADVSGPSDVSAAGGGDGIGTAAGASEAASAASPEPGVLVAAPATASAPYVSPDLKDLAAMLAAVAAVATAGLFLRRALV